MKLLTKELLKKLPKLYEARGDPEARAIVKFFTPDSIWTWYAVEFDGQNMFYGLVVGHFAELGYFSLSGLKKIRGPWGLPIERDLYFEPTPISELKAKHS